jgi:hypothetical protein
MGKVKAPAERGYLSEMQSALSGQMGIQGQLLSAEKEFTPQYQALQKQALMGQMGNLASIYAQTNDQSVALQQQNLQSQGALYGQVGGYARNAYQNTLDPTTAGLYNTMASQAASGLADGRNLSEQEMRMSQGNARAAMAARGMQFGNQAIAAEVLNSYDLANKREDRARQYAGGVYGVGQQNALQAMNMYGQPLMNQMNQFSTPTMLGQSQQMYGGLGAKLFQPESQYNAQIISANQQNQMQAEMANAQAKAGMISAGIGAIGSMGAGFLGNAGLFGATTGATGAGFSVGGMTNVGGSKLGAGTIYGAPSNASKVSFR